MYAIALALSVYAAICTHYFHLLQITVYDIPSHYSSTNQLLDADAITTESSYVCPTKIVGRFTTDYYEEAPREYDNYSNHVQPICLIMCSMK